MKKLAFALTLGLIIVAVQSALAKPKDPADYLDAPQNFLATVSDPDVVFTWDAVDGADKYTVEICASVLLDGAAEPVIVELSYCTADRTDGGSPTDPNLTVPIDTLLNDIASELGVDVGLILSVDATAKVKGLNPANGHGAQNNPFSEPSEFTIEIA